MEKESGGTKEYLKRLYSFIEGLWWSAQLNGKKNISLGSILEKQASRYRNKPLILFEDREISYSLFNETANRYSHLFQKRGFIKGDIVALLMENRPEFLMVHAGLVKIGVIPALVNSSLKGEHLADMINITEARAMVIGAECVAEYLKIKSIVKLKKPGSVFVEMTGSSIKLPAGKEDLKNLIAAEPVSNPSTLPPINSADTIEYIFTSGATGAAKCIELKQQRWLKLGYYYGGAALRATGDDIQYLCLPLYHNSAINIAWPATLIHGGTLALASKFSAEGFWDETRRCSASFFIYNGEMCRFLNNQPPGEDDHNNTVRQILGSGISGEYSAQFQRRFGIRKIIEVYSIAEGVGSLANLDGVHGMIGRLSSGGRSGEVVKYDIENSTIVRGKSGRAVKCRPGETGLYIAAISGTNPFTGYKNDKNRSRSQIVEDVFKKGDRYYLSGDLFEVHKKNYVSFAGRISDIIRHKGKVFAADKVSDILSGYGIFDECTVYAVKQIKSQESFVMAAITLIPGVKFDPSGFASYADQNLPLYMVPSILRITETINVNSAFHKTKYNLQNEGFDPATIKDPLYVLDRDRGRYIRITKPVYNDIIKGAF